MASARDNTARRAQLEQILLQTATAAHGLDAHAAEVHLASVPLERIRSLTHELGNDLSGHIDEVDALIMQTLLHEYATAVGHLRTVARMTAEKVDEAGPHLRAARRALHRHTKSIQGALANGLADK